MFVLKRLGLCATLLFASLAISSPALADQAVEVLDESTAEHCGTVSVTSHMVSGGCHIEVDGQEVELSGHVFGIEAHALTCDNTFDINIEEDGEGIVSNMLVTQGDAHDEACNQVRPCISEGTHGETHPAENGLAAPVGNESAEHAWAFDLEETGIDTFAARVNTCFHTEEAIEECEGEIDLTVTRINEDLFEAVASDAALPERLQDSFATHCELSAHYDLTEEADENIHISH